MDMPLESSCTSDQERKESAQDSEEKAERDNHEEAGKGKDQQANVDQQAERQRRWEMFYKARMREVVPGLFLGNVDASHRAVMLRENRINAIVSLTDARWAWWNDLTRNAGVLESRHKWVRCLDSSTQDILVHMNDICDFIEQMAPPVLQSSSTLLVDYKPELCDQDTVNSGAVLVHCDLGISRSPSIIIAYLMRKYGAGLEDVPAFLQTKQRVKPSANFIRQHKIWEQVRYQIWENEEKTVPKAPYQVFLDDRAVLLEKKGLPADGLLPIQNL